MKELIQEITSKPLQTHSALRHAFEREVTFCLNLNLYSSNLAARETHGEENLKELVQEITSRALQTDSALRHTFGEKSLLIESKPSKHHFFLNLDTFCELPTTQYCVVGVGYTYISDKPGQCFKQQLKCSRYTIQCVAFLTTKQALRYTGTRSTCSCPTRDGRRRLRPLPTCYLIL